MHSRHDVIDELVPLLLNAISSSAVLAAKSTNFSFTSSGHSEKLTAVKVFFIEAINMLASLRVCSRIIRRQSHIRHFSKETKGSFFGYECSQYAHRDYDLTLLEK